MTPSPSRRAVLAASTVSPSFASLTLSPGAARAVAAEPFDAKALAAAVNHDAARGNKASGGAGELTGIIKAAHPAAAGAHRYRPCREDDMRCVVPPPIAAIARAARTLIEGTLAQQAPA